MRYHDVECCAGVRRIPVRLVALDIVELPGPIRCTRCGGVPRDVEDSMAKITRFGGPSDKVNDPPQVPAEPDKPTRAEDAPADEPEPVGDDEDQADATDADETASDGDAKPAKKAAKKATPRKATKAA